MAYIKAAFTKLAAPHVLESTDQRWNMFPYLMVVMVLLTLVALFHVWSRVTVIDLNLQISEADSTISVAKQEASRLRLEIASLKTPERIEKIAKEDLGMTLPTDVQIRPVP
jgi:cell division protein FtsL